MGISRRIRTIAISQIDAIKARLDRIDAEEEEAVAQRRDRELAVDELKDPGDIRLTPRRTPEEIAAGVPAAATRPTPAPAPPKAIEVPGSPLATQYRILGLEDGADLESVEAAYSGLAARCSPDRFPDGSEREAAAEIFKRVDSAYETLKEALDPTVGRFDKLEL